MGGGNLSDQQLKEFDEYLSNSGVKQPTGSDSVEKPAPQPAPVSAPIPDPAPVPTPVEEPVREEVSQPAPAVPAQSPVDDSYLDDIINLHERKADDILDLLDKIDAKSHKDIVADLVDEMQYQRSIIRREQDQADNLKQLFKLAADATK